MPPAVDNCLDLGKGRDHLFSQATIRDATKRPQGQKWDAMQNSQDSGPLSVIIVSYCSADVIEACLDSLLASKAAQLRIAVCDNASPDDSIAVVTGWAQHQGVSFTQVAAGDYPSADQSWLTLIKAPQNLGFAGGVNLGLSWFLAQPDIGLFWILNPDSMAEPDTVARYLACAKTSQPFSLMGGRTRFVEAPGLVQSDGGRIRRGTGGICLNVNHGIQPDIAIPPPADSLDFLSGANMVASRAFIETAGLMQEDYFLYYEEVDWAYRRGALPLIICPDAVVRHHGGTVIGSTSATQQASGFANYFNFRNRMRFVWRFARLHLPVTYALSLYQIAKIALRGGREEAQGALRGLHQLPPPRAVRDRVHPNARPMAFGRWGRS